MDSNPITYFGETDARNKKIRFGIKESDRLRHVYVIGKTGVGKSTFLENMAIQDIQNGNGIAFIDPHGSTAEKLLDYIPENRIKDVLYFAPFDLEHPVSFNVLEDIGVDKRHLVVNGLMSTFEKIWEDAWSARMSYILINSLLALLEYPGATLLGVNRMLSDKEYRRKVVDNVKDPSVKTFWVEEFGKYTDKYAAEATPAIQNKIGQFTSNPLVRNLIGQPKSSFDIRKIMDEKKILIINLSKGLVGEGNAKLIGSMLITKMYLAAMSRADKDKSELGKLPNFYLYVDEFQSFANKSFADILSEARKYKLSLNITHQYIEQMEEEVRDAVFGNVGTMITFRVGAFDAEVLEKEFAPTFTAEDLVNLGKYQLYLKLMIDEVSSHPFSAVSMSPIERPEKTFKREVIESSWIQFTRPRKEVEDEIKKWHEVDTGNFTRPATQNDFQRGDNRGNNIGNNNFRNNRDGGQNRDLYPQKNSQQFLKPIQKVETDEEKKPVLQTAQLPVIDPNKLAFAKAGEELKSKIESAHVPLHEVNNMKENYSSRQNASLSTLRSDNKKEPSKENISNLKSALSEVLAKSSQKDLTARSAESGFRQKSESIKDNNLEVQRKSDDLKPKPISQTFSENKIEENHQDSLKEVPEKVLRELLK